uniref:Uncharacterized protein n=1 Tax=Rhizophora mucronata TaxID=61149 RepID=A0A2P2IV95_RHIMU
MKSNKVLLKSNIIPSMVPKELTYCPHQVPQQPMQDIPSKNKSVHPYMQDFHNK